MKSKKRRSGAKRSSRKPPDPAKRNAIGTDKLHQPKRSNQMVHHPLDPASRNAIGTDSLPGMS